MNVRGLDCVTSGHAHIYTARRTGEVIDTRHPLQLRTSTRGFHNTVELQQAMSRPYPRKASAEEAAWQQARVVRSRLGHNGEVAAAPHAPAACASWQPLHATRRCSSTMSSIGRRANTMHLCTENIRSRSRSHRSLPSKNHAATPPQNLAAVEALFSVARGGGE